MTDASLSAVPTHWYRRRRGPVTGLLLSRPLCDPPVGGEFPYLTPPLRRAGCAKWRVDVFLNVLEASVASTRPEVVFLAQFDDASHHALLDGDSESGA